MGATTAFTRSRAHARLIPAEVSDLFARCITDCWNQVAEPTDDELHRLATYYGITPRTMAELITRLAQDRRDVFQGAL